MELLAEITDAGLGIGPEPEYGREYRLRKSARGIILNEAGEMAVQYLKTYDFHKLPGGGVDQGESIENALRREIQEEVGCACADIEPVGVVIEYRDRQNILHISYGFSAKVSGQIGEVALEPGEIEEGQTTRWLKPEITLEQMKQDEPKKPEGHFILAREIAFVEAFLESKQ